jgi:rSAM/selenodomain-associated transferase 2
VIEAVGSIAVVIAVRNEAERLPLLLADLQKGELPLAELVVVDGASSDATALVARLAGARVVGGAPSRGGQMALGAAVTQANWLLFLHGDGRLPAGWDRAVAQVLARESANAQAPKRKTRPSAWYFRLAIDAALPALRLVEWAVALRSQWRQLPYGDQGLLVSRRLYLQVGGFASVALMEDLDLVLRLKPHCRLRCLGVPVRVDGRRWIERGVWAVGWSNWLLRRAWRRGVNCQALASRYYDKTESTRKSQSTPKNQSTPKKQSSRD